MSKALHFEKCVYTSFIRIDYDSDKTFALFKRAKSGIKLFPKFFHAFFMHVRACIIMTFFITENVLPFLLFTFVLSISGGKISLSHNRVGQIVKSMYVVVKF